MDSQHLGLLEHRHYFAETAVAHKTYNPPQRKLPGYWPAPAWHYHDKMNWNYKFLDQFIYIYIYIYIDIYKYIYMYIHIYVYVCLCILPSFSCVLYSSLSPYNDVSEYIYLVFFKFLLRLLFNCKHLENWVSFHLIIRRVDASVIFFCLQVASNLNKMGYTYVESLIKCYYEVA